MAIGTIDKRGIEIKRVRCPALGKYKAGGIKVIAGFTKNFITKPWNHSKLIKNLLINFNQSITFRFELRRYGGTEYKWSDEYEFFKKYVTLRLPEYDPNIKAFLLKIDYIDKECNIKGARIEEVTETYQY